MKVWFCLPSVLGELTDYHVLSQSKYVLLQSFLDRGHANTCARSWCSMATTFAGKNLDLMLH